MAVFSIYWFYIMIYNNALMLIIYVLTMFNFYINIINKLFNIAKH
jgi:hypothetical protein